jgi:hypothetical protein
VGKPKVHLVRQLWLLVKLLSLANGPHKSCTQTSSSSSFLSPRHLIPSLPPMMHTGESHRRPGRAAPGSRRSSCLVVGTGCATPGSRPRCPSGAGRATLGSRRATCRSRLHHPWEPAAPPVESRSRRPSRLVVPHLGADWDHAVNLPSGAPMDITLLQSSFLVDLTRRCRAETSEGSAGEEGAAEGGCWRKWSQGKK